MADEKDDDNLEGQDESEYHFTEEEEINYDLENEHPEESETVKPAEGVSLKDRSVAFFNQNRRPIIGGLVFLAVVFIVYQIIMPAAPPPPSTEIAPVSATQRPTPAAPAPPSTQPTTAPINNLAGANPLVGSFPPSTTPPGTTTTPGAAPGTGTSPATTSSAVQGQALPQTPLPGQVIPTPPTGTLPGQTIPSQTPAATVSAGAASPSLTPGTTLATPPPGQVTSSAQPPAIQTAPPPTPIPAGQTTTTTYTVPGQPMESSAARLTPEQQAQIAEYAAKLAAADAQNAALQNKIQDLNNRMGNIEAGLNQITQILIRRQSSRAVAVRTEVHVPYAVTAIIPGRAWLKSECGDTVTVAEGDVLKGIGRITKIDPYDGTVVIDTGIKPVTLTYGVTG